MHWRGGTLQALGFDTAALNHSPFMFAILHMSTYM